MLRFRSFVPARQTRSGAFGSIVLALILALTGRGAVADDEVSIINGTPIVTPVYNQNRGLQTGGTPLGGFDLSVLLSNAFLYEDNVFAKGTSPHGDFLQESKEQVALVSHWSRHQLSFFAGSEQDTFLRLTSENSISYVTNLNGRLDLGDNLVATARAGYAQEPELPQSPETIQGQFKLPVYDTTSTSVSLIRTGTRVTNDFKSNFEQIAYTSAANFSRNKIVTSVSDRLSYELSGYLAPFIQGDMSKTNFHFAPSKRDFDDMSGSIGITLAVPTILEGDFSVGTIRQSYRLDGLRPQNSPIFDIDLTWNVRPLTTVIAKASRTVTGIEILGGLRPSNKEADFVPGRGVQRVTSASVEMQHEIWHNLLVKNITAYMRNEFSTNDLIDDVYENSTELDYLVTRQISLEFGYEHRMRTANLPRDRTYNSGPYEANIFGLSAIGTF